MERFVHAALLWLACAFVLWAAAGCGQGQNLESGAAPPPPQAPPATAPVASPAAAPSSLDLSGVIRRVHFAFRPEGDAWTGGHSTYAVQVREAELSVTPYQPVSGPPTAGGSSAQSIAGAPFVAVTQSIERGGSSILGASRGVSLQDDSILQLDRGGVIEKLQNTEEGVEQSFTFTERPAGQGDVTVRLSVSGQEYTGQTEHGLHFVHPQTGLGVRYGVATWIDAAGHATGLKTSFDGAAIVLAVPADVVDKSAYPAVLDPTVGPEIGTDNPIYAAAINDQQQTATAYGNGSFLVVWQDSRFGGLDLYGARVTTAGTLLDVSGIPVGVAKGNQTLPAIAFDGTNWMVTWTDTRTNPNGDIYAARVSTAGSVLDPNGIAVSTGGVKNISSIAYDGVNYFVTYANSTGPLTLQGTFVSPAGTVNPTPVTITTQSSGFYAQGVSYNGTNHLAAYEYYVNPSYRVGAKRVTPGGTVLDATEISLTSSSGGYNPMGIASDGVNWLVAWNPVSTSNVYGGRVSSAGAALDGSGFPIGTTTGFQGTNLSVAFAGNGYGVFWDASNEIYGARVSSGGAVFVPATAIVNETGNSGYPSAAHDGTNFLVAFRDTRLNASNNPADIFGLRVSNALAKVDLTSLLLSQAANSQFRPSVAYNGTNYLVVWDDTRPGTTSDIYGARISATGTVLDAGGLVLSQAANPQSSPSVASNGTDWLVAWRDDRGADPDVYGTRVQANGNVLEPMGLLIAGGSTTQTAPAVGSDGTNYLVTWAVSSGDVYGARVTSAGAVLDASGFAISSGGGSVPALAYNGTNYLVAWTKPTNSNDIFGARVTPGGTVLDAGALSIPITANVGVAETNAGVSSNGTTWLVVWNDSTDVRGARVNASGTVLDPVGISISSAANIQSFPDTSWDGSQYWVVWQDERSTAGYTDIYAARMSSAGIVTDTMGLAVSTDVLQSEQRPVIAAGKPKENLVSYYRFDPQQPYGATRVRSRLVTDPAPGANGTPCTMPAQCTSGFCVDGVCCDLACTGVCQACTAAKKGAGADGACGTIKVDTDPDNECTDQGAPTCGTTGDCNGSGACKLYAAGTDCGAVCAGNSVQNKACDGAGACTNSGAPMDCTPYACSAGACKTSCMTSADCAAGYNCNGGVCGSALPNGSSCSMAGQCQSGFCVDSVCCNSLCTGLCQACSAAKKGTGGDGTCGPVVSGADPDSECDQMPQNTCGQTGNCNGSGACALYASGTSCGSPVCQGNILTPQVCNGLGTCAPSGMGQNCAPYACVSGACKTSCVTNSDCATGYVCGLGVCVPPTADGGACNVGSECLSGYCVDGVCCNTACSGVCQACTFAKKGNGTDGVCGPVVTGTDPDNDCAMQAPASCGQTGQCNGTGACQLYPQGTSCGASVCQGNTVTGQICNGSGLCVNDPVGQSCAPYICSSGACTNPCMNNNECISGYLCLNGACIPIGGQGTPCTNGLECQSGYCVESVCCNSACTGTCVACAAAKKGQGSDGVCEPIKNNTDPDNECAAQAPTTCGQSGLCNGMGACGLYPAGTTCSPPSCTGTTQTNASLCDGQGVCTPGSTVECVQGYVCTGDTCATDCTDDSSCAPGYHCEPGFGYCAPGDPPDAGTDGGTSTGTAGAGGATGAGGNGGASTGGAGGNASGGAGGTASSSGTMGSAAGGAPGGEGGDQGGCGCRTAGSESSSPAGWAGALVLAIAASLRRKRHAITVVPAGRCAGATCLVIVSTLMLATACGGSDGSTAATGGEGGGSATGASVASSGSTASAGTGTGSGSGSGTGGSTGGPLVDPGTGDWVPVPPDQVLDVCRLDPQKLQEIGAQLTVPWAIVRYGRLCYESPASATMLPANAWSTTKTFGALVAGIVAYQTRDIPRTGLKTGPFRDEDRADHWLGSVTYHPEAHVAHVLAMVAHNPSLALGQKTMAYDTVGSVQINSLSQMLNAAIDQDPARLGADLEQFTQKFVFGPLGMHQSAWSGGAPEKNFAYTWDTTVRDMARVGLLMMHKGMWNGERLLDADWIYRMTHPAFEDGNTGYGYLTWLNASSNHHFGGILGTPVGLQQVPMSPGPCAPVSVYPAHPHGLSDSPDCHYDPPYSCNQMFDVGVWQAVGLGGQVIQGHPGLHMVLVARDLTPFGSGPDAPRILWDAVRPAVVAADPTFAGDDAAFCAAYGSNTYAPDL